MSEIDDILEEARRREKWTATGGVLPRYGSEVADPYVPECSNCGDWGRIGLWSNLRGEICTCTKGQEVRARIQRQSVTQKLTAQKPAVIPEGRLASADPEAEKLVANLAAARAMPPRT